MDGRSHLVLERGRDEPLALDAGLSRKAGGNDRQPEMRFAFQPMAGMPLVEVGLVHDLQPLWRKRGFKLAAYGLCDRHEPTRYANR